MHSKDLVVILGEIARAGQDHCSAGSCNALYRLLNKATVGFNTFWLVLHPELYSDSRIGWSTVKAPLCCPVKWNKFYWSQLLVILCCQPRPQAPLWPYTNLKQDSQINHLPPQAVITEHHMQLYSQRIIWIHFANTQGPFYKSPCQYAPWWTELTEVSNHPRSSIG